MPFGVERVGYFYGVGVDSVDFDAVARNSNN